MAGNDQYLIPGLFPFSRLCGNPESLNSNRTEIDKINQGQITHELER